MSRLLLDLAEKECQLAALALAVGRVRLGVRSLDRASHYLRLRHDGPDRSAEVLPMWGRE